LHSFALRNEQAFRAASFPGWFAGMAKKRRMWALVAKDHPAHLIAQTRDFFRICSASETLGEIKKHLLFALFRLYAALNEFDQHTVLAELPCLRQATNFGSDSPGQCNRLPHYFTWRAHVTIITIMH
jgi:hypothetical protein